VWGCVRSFVDPELQNAQTDRSEHRADQHSIRCCICHARYNTAEDLVCLASALRGDVCKSAKYPGLLSVSLFVDYLVLGLGSDDPLAVTLPAGTLEVG
jgi:hypothetical protein